MISKERVLTVLEHKPADRVPVTNRYTPEIASELARIVGVSSRDSFDLEVALGHDMLCMKEIGIVNSYNVECNSKINNEYIDEFGIVKRIVEYGGGSYLEIVKNPLENLDAWTSYRFPDPSQQTVFYVPRIRPMERPFEASLHGKLAVVRAVFRRLPAHHIRLEEGVHV